MERLPLSLYVHLPWCVRKCPYCDFNSHRAGARLPEDAYVDALIRDLDFELPRIEGRPLLSIFFGGGTPSLFSAASVDRILAAVRARLVLVQDCEITLEANPGASDQARFVGYRAAGVNRLSIGVQSLDDAALARLGRIHDAAAARAAMAATRAAGFDNINLDLMYGLPEQGLDRARADLDGLMALAPEHVSCYQLTLEPGTPFFCKPPALPDEEALAQMHEQAATTLAAGGYHQYEVSAWARPGRACRHNGNYWRFGDYLGIGAGAHSKISDAHGVLRLARQPLPNRFVAAAGGAAVYHAQQRLRPTDLRFEFLMNALRLTEGFDHALYAAHTGLAWSDLLAWLQPWIARALLHVDGDRLAPTTFGARHLDGLLAELLPDGEDAREITAALPARAYAG